MAEVSELEVEELAESFDQAVESEPEADAYADWPDTFPGMDGGASPTVLALHPGATTVRASSAGTEIGQDDDLFPAMNEPEFEDWPDFTKLAEDAGPTSSVNPDAGPDASSGFPDVFPPSPVPDTVADLLPTSDTAVDSPGEMPFPWDQVEKDNYELGPDEVWAEDIPEEELAAERVKAAEPGMQTHAFPDGTTVHQSTQSMPRPSPMPQSEHQSVELASVGGLLSRIADAIGVLSGERQGGGQTQFRHMPSPDGPIQWAFPDIGVGHGGPGGGAGGSMGGWLERSESYPTGSPAVDVTSLNGGRGAGGWGYGSRAEGTSPTDQFEPARRRPGEANV